MGIDHGLGGKETLRSRQRRQKKAKRLKSITKSLMTDGFNNRNEIKFDEAARVAFVTGMHERKLERRKFGIAMQILKEKKSRRVTHREKEKFLLERGKQQEAEAAARNKADASSEEEEEEEEDDHSLQNRTREEDGDREDANVLQKSTFADDATVSMFGSAVSVVVSDDIKDQNEEFFSQSRTEDDEEEEEDEGKQGSDVEEEDFDNRSVGSRASRASHTSYKSSSSYQNNKNKHAHKSPFQRALAKAKQIIGTRKKKNNIDRSKHLNSKFKKQVKSSKLLTKAYNTHAIKMKR